MDRTATAIIVSAVLLGASVLGAGIAVGALVPDAPTESPQVERTDPTPDRSITVGASGRARTQPDEAIVRIAVTATAEDASTARSRVADDVTAVRTALSELGIGGDRVRTIDYDIYERRDDRPPEKGGDGTARYRASHDLEIVVTDVDRAGAVIDAAVEAGATTVRDVRFTLAEETRRELRRQALDDAMTNARAQADALGARADLTVTGVGTITTSEVDYPRPRYEVALAAGSDGGGTDLASGPVTVRASVVVSYNASA